MGRRGGREGREWREGKGGGVLLCLCGTGNKERRGEKGHSYMLTNEDLQQKCVSLGCDYFTKAIKLTQHTSSGL